MKRNYEIIFTKSHLTIKGNFENFSVFSSDIFLFSFLFPFLNSDQSFSLSIHLIKQKVEEVWVKY